MEKSGKEYQENKGILRKSKKSDSVRKSERGRKKKRIRVYRA